MNTFLKVLLVAAVLLVALKFSPLIFLGAFIGMIAAIALGAVGFSLVAALLAVALALAIALSPIWIPVLVVIGLVSLLRGPKAATPTIAT